MTTSHYSSMTTIVHLVWQFGNQWIGISPTCGDSQGLQRIRSQWLVCHQRGLPFGHLTKSNVYGEVERGRSLELLILLSDWLMTHHLLQIVRLVCRRIAILFLLLNRLAQSQGTSCLVVSKSISKSFCLCLCPPCLGWRSSMILSCSGVWPIHWVEENSYRLPWCWTMRNCQW